LIESKDSVVQILYKQPKLTKIIQNRKRGRKS